MVAEPLEPAAEFTFYFHGRRELGGKEGVAICVVIGDVTVRIWEPIVGHVELIDRLCGARESEGCVVMQGARTAGNNKYTDYTYV